MKKWIIFIAAILPIGSFASIDYNCLSDCTDKGYMYAFCQSKCSYGDNDSQRSSNNNRDYQCVSDCTDKGYQYSYCQEHCSY